jgi:hypothetical protein
MVYPESLFMLFAALCLLALLQERLLLAGLSASLAGVVRPNGLVMAACCAWAAGMAIRRGSWWALVAPVLAPVGAVIHFAYLFAHTGDPLAFFHVEARGWNQRFDLGISNIHRIADGFRDFNLKAFIVAASLAGGVAALYLVLRWRPPAPVVIYVVGILGLTMLTTAAASLPRYFLGAFPALIPVARALPDRAFPVVAAASAVLMSVLFFATGTGRISP